MLWQKKANREKEEERLSTLLGWCTAGVKEVRTDSDILKSYDRHAYTPAALSCHFLSLVICFFAVWERRRGRRRWSTDRKRRDAITQYFTFPPTRLFSLLSLCHWLLWKTWERSLADVKKVNMSNWFLHIGKQIARQLVVSVSPWCY